LCRIRKPSSLHKNRNLRINWFTADLTGDSHIWLEDQTGTPGKIIEYNDDCTLPSDFSWGNNARIREYVSTNVRALIVSSHSSWNPTGNCDVYMNCMNSPSTLPKQTDAIQSAPYSTSYNCIAWSGGVLHSFVYTWFWPPDEGNDWEAKSRRGHSDHDLTSFDNYYANISDGDSLLLRHSPPVMRFIRAGSYSSSSCIALWGQTVEGEEQFTHASVRKPSNDQPHGYDWESKIGLYSDRCFHPGDALSDYYDSILHYYVKSGYSDISMKSAFLQESADFDIDKQVLMKEMVQAYSDKPKFDELYESWKNTLG
jgi:hypothetical protein